MEPIRFALLGLATGAIYALLALGLVLIYRGSGLLNFAQGAMAMFGAYAYYELTVKRGVPNAVAVPIALAACAALGAAIHLVVLRAMRRRNAAPVARVIATLAVLLILQSAALLIYDAYPLPVPSLLPTSNVKVLSTALTLTADRLFIIGICLVLSAVLYGVYRWTPFGRVTTAVAENEIAAASLGYSPDVVAAVNWAVGSALAGLAGILIAPILFLQPTTLVLLVIPALAAGLLGGFSSFPIVLAAALGLGVVQSEISRYVGGVGWTTVVPFGVVVAYLVARGRALPLRSFVLDRPPAVGTGRVRPIVVAPLAVVGGVAVLAADGGWDSAIVTTCGGAIICLSVVLLTGYAGQLSLAQFVIAGIGAFLAAKLASHMAFVPALALGSVATGAAGALLGLPALRTRGATLAVVTLCLGSAVIAAVFDNSGWTGGLSGIALPSLTLLGWSIDPVVHPDRYALFTFLVMVAVALVVANVRRGVTGRQLLAVRSNERAAASLGVPVAGVKVYAFFLSASIAAVGGVLLAFVQPSVQMSEFDVFTSILLVGLTVIGGVGYVPGALFGAALITGGVLDHVIGGWSAASDYLPLVGACGLLFTLMSGPDGMFASALRTLSRPIAALDRLEARLRPGRATGALLDATAEAVVVEHASLRIDAVSVSFGGVHAVRDVSLEVLPGQVHGLIGPNGAGKTTLIDAITGFARTEAGTINLGGRDITGLGPRRRAQLGLSRSFQSLELFDDLSVAENLAVASQAGGARRRLVDLVRPTPVAFGAAGRAAIRNFELETVLDAPPTAISFGRRKVVAIARAVASAPSVLLLDEPAAGLDDTEAEELGALIRQLADDWGVAVLLVEHKVDLIMSTCDTITVMAEGQVLASGPPEEIRAHQQVLDAYLGGVAA